MAAPVELEALTISLTEARVERAHLARAAAVAALALMVAASVGRVDLEEEEAAAAVTRAEAGLAERAVPAQSAVLMAGRAATPTAAVAAAALAWAEAFSVMPEP